MLFFFVVSVSFMCVIAIPGQECATWTHKYRPLNDKMVVSNHNHAHDIASWFNGWQSPHFIEDENYPRSVLNDRCD